MKKAAVALAFLFPTAMQANTEKEINCLALNVYHEARGEMLEGQIAVAEVTMNRVHDAYWPDTVCGVVYQKSQFSWTHLKKDHTPHDEDAWITAQLVAENVYEGLLDDITNGSVFYHSTSVKPFWSKKPVLVKELQMDDHIFYSWKGHW